MNTTLDDINKICLPELKINTGIIPFAAVSILIKKKGSLLLEIDSFGFY